jgi:tetratricopeptide (TPR) repeat protein
MLFYALTLAVPLLFVCVLELVLRAINAWPEPSLFTTVMFRGQTYAIMNPAVKSRYFARTAFSPGTSQDCLLLPKPAGTFRIFCLGGSTTVGYPYWFNGSFSSFLRDRLHRTFPERPIEVINLGMTAINSYTVVDMARELHRYQPDLLIVYDGHNEFYGALGAASRESLNAPRWLTALYLRLLHFRTVLAVREIVASIIGEDAPSTTSRSLGTMMERLAWDKFVPYGSPTYARALEDFGGNLEELKHICAEHGIPLVLATQVSNLRDQPPFVSSDPGGHAGERMHALLDAGAKQYALGHFDSALVSFRDALPFDTLHSDTYYRVARCLDTLGHTHEAELAYRRARDFDQLRFRTSSDFNNAILSAGNDSTVLVVEMEQVFREHSPDSLIGNALLFEHLHPRAFGQFLMAGAFARAMRERGLLAPRTGWAAADTIPDKELWDARSITALDELTARRRTEVLLSGWPFTDRVPVVADVKRSDTLAEIAELYVRGEWSWLDAHQHAAAYYMQRNDLENAAREYRTIINQQPLLGGVQPYLQLGRILKDQGKTIELQEVLLSSLGIEPTMLVYRALGDLSLLHGRPSDAVPYYQHTFDFWQSEQERVENGYLLAEAFSRAGRLEQARGELQKVLRLQPDYGPALRLEQALPGEGK